MDRLPPFKYSIDATDHLLPTRQELNKIIKTTFTDSLCRSLGLTPRARLKMAFYAEDFMVVRDGLIIPPLYTLRHWVHSIPPLGQFRVGSHRLQAEADHQINRSEKNLPVVSSSRGRDRGAHHLLLPHLL